MGIAVLVWETASGLSGTGPRRIVIDYPEDGSLFPPEIAPPAFLWRDAQKNAAAWRIDVSLADGSPPIRTAAPGRHLQIGRIDPDCVSPTNELPK